MKKLRLDRVGAYLNQEFINHFTNYEILIIIYLYAFAEILEIVE